MNILNRLTIKNLLLNKKRTIVTLIGIILSTALICGVATLVTSFQNALIEEAKMEYGNYHTIFYDIPKDKQKYLLNNVNIKNSMVTKDVGYAKLEGSTNLLKPYVYLREFDDNAIKNLPIKLVDGRLPKNSNEIIISERIISDGEVKLKIGDKITLGLGKRMFDGDELNQNNPIVSSKIAYGNYIEGEDEELVVKFTKEFEIVGIMQRPYYETYSTASYIIISHLDENIYDSADISVLYKNVRDTYKITEEISGKNNEKKESNEKYDYEYNSNLLRFSGVSKDDNINTTIYVLSSIIISIIVVTAIFVIRNSFSISITERFRQYGMLASVGATSKQIKKNVLYEGMILGLISIPIGILSGIFAIFILLKVVNMIIGDYFDSINLVLAVSPISILVAIFISAITILLSSFIPAIKASKISPLEAIRSNNDIKIKGKKLKISKVYQKLFAIEGEIALKNLKRSKKKYRTTILSIALSIIAFISINTFIEYGFNMSNMYYEEYDYNIRVNYTVEDNGDSLKYFNNIIKLDNINNYSIRKQSIQNIELSKYATDITKQVYGKAYNENGEEIEEPNYTIYFIAVGDKNYKDYLSKLGLDEKEYENKGILLNRGMTILDSKRVEYDYINIKENDKLEFYHTFDKEKREIVIGKITEELPFAVNKEFYAPVVIISDKYIENLEYSIDSLLIDSSNATELEKDIEKLDEFVRGSVYNLEEAVRENNSIKLVISIFLYGFITVIILIGVTNIFNTITTNMALRHKEFAILKSIGMTDKDFRKMINFESIFYGLKSLLYGLPIGLLLSYFISKAVGISIKFNYVFPYKAVIICIIFVILIVWITMRYSLKKAEKLNIIDTIRNENI